MTKIIEVVHLGAEFPWDLEEKVNKICKQYNVVGVSYAIEHRYLVSGYSTLYKPYHNALISIGG